ncbi:ionotropic receptor 75a [Diachasma alloeum]|uniref:Ionotropic receptor 75u n=1 Tax=Diachasma alloeum TaxID=454923 RepID=A0A4E0S0V3_9HYME|nr:ionotropic receptor 75a [Diachasma alloeum]THK32890.1 ionotropic receptor 75u [Diachasma alloeum]
MMREIRAIAIAWILLNLLARGRSDRIDAIIGNFITDVSSSLLVSSSFTGFFCMESDDIVKFSRQISRNYLLHKIASFNDSDLIDISQIATHNHYFVVDLDCPDGADFLIKANTRRLFIAPAKWLILRDLRNQDELRGLPYLQSMVEMNEDTLISLLSNFDIFPDSEVIVGQRLNETTVQLSSLYRPNSDHSLTIENLGSWDDEGGLCLCSHDQSSRRRVNLQGTVLKTSLVMTDLNTINHLTDYQDKLIDAVTKASYMWIVYLSERMNATFNFTVERTWGYKNEDGNWNGMIGLLDRGEINIGGTATFMISQRIGVVDYVQLYTPTGSRFLFRRPPLSYVSNIFTLPFARSVWIAIVAFLTISFGFLYITMKWEWEKMQAIPLESRLGGDLEGKPTVTDNLLVLLGAIFQQGFSCEPRTISTRIVVLMVLLIALSLYAAYTANIVALLQSTADSIKTLDDLMNSPLKIGIFDIVYNRYYFGAFEDPVRKEFYERLVKDKPAVWMPLEEGIRKVREGLFAFHVDLGFGYQMMQETYAEDEKCGIEEIDYLKVYDPLLVIERQSPFREIIRVGALWIAETGLKPRVASKFFTQKPPCIGSTSFVSVGIIDCYVAMLAIVYGCAISVGILLLENLWRRCIGERRSHDNTPLKTSLPESSLTRDEKSATQSSTSLQIEELFG